MELFENLNSLVCFIGRGKPDPTVGARGSGLLVERSEAVTGEK